MLFVAILAFAAVQSPPVAAPAEQGSLAAPTPSPTASPSSGQAPASPARPTSPTSPTPTSTPAAIEARRSEPDTRESRKSRRQRRLAGVGFVGRDRANMFQSNVPTPWDALTLINTDRPDFTDALPTVGHRVTYIETGYNFAKAEGSFKTTTLTHTAPEVLVRYGFHDRVELRLKATPGIVKDNSNGELRLIGEHYVGLKAEVFRQKGWWPGHTLVPVVNFANGLKKDGGHLIVPELGWVYGWQVRKWIAFRGSTGVSGAPNRLTFGAGPNAGFLEVWQSVSIYWHLHRYVGIHTELGMFARPLEPIKADRTVGFQTYGIYFYPTPELLIDIRVGDNLREPNSSWYLGGGISFRIKPLYASRAERLKARHAAGSRVPTQPAPLSPPAN